MESKKLKPAKQALADAIYQNGGWVEGGDWHKNGELPPVGEVCQFFSEGYDDDWFDWCIFRGSATCGGFIIEHHHRTSPNRTTVTLFDPSSTKFRPIRTERERAIDDMVCEFIDHHGDPKGGERYIGIAAKLYDAGYRKEVK